MYHDLPFEGMNHLKRHRGNTRGRIDKIDSLCTIKGKTFLDLGCSVGGLSLGMAEKGAKHALGVDYDADSIQIASEAAKQLKFDKAEFRVQEIDMDFMRNIPRFDRILWFSNWMWIVKKYGMEYAKNMLYLASRKCNVMLFESAADDGKARIKGATQNDIFRWLGENTTFKSVKNCHGTGGWMSRNVYLCYRNRYWSRSGTTSIVERVTENAVKKTYKHKSFLWMKDREVEALSRLERYKHYPRVISVGEDHIIMDYVGLKGHVNRTMKDQGLEIIEELKSAGINNRDIRPCHFLSKGDGILYMIDFGWSIFDDEIESPKAPPGSIRGKKGISDEQSVLNFFNK